MSLPHFVPFPDTQIRQRISPADWHLYLDSWTSLANAYLRLDDHAFLSITSESKDDLARFLVSFSYQMAHDPSPVPKGHLLRKQCFYLVHRLLSQDESPSILFTWTALADFSQLFLRSEQFHALVQGIWKRQGDVIETSLQRAKTSLIQNLESKRPEDAVPTLDRLGPLLKTSTDASIYMLTGSDFLDALYTAYPQVAPDVQKKLVAVVYMGLMAILRGPKPNYSLLSDHLYSLKSNEEQEHKKKPNRRTLVTDLVTNTRLLEQIRERSSVPEAVRVIKTATSLGMFRQSTAVRPRKIIRRKGEKAKENEVQEIGREARTEQIQVHRMSMITQVQDLFPDLGAGFIMKLLDRYNDNIEQVTAHLLEDTLPGDLAHIDRSEPLQDSAPPGSQPHMLPLVEQQLPERHNVFNDDEFDKLAIDASRLHIGRRGAELTADAILSDRSNLPAKSSILAALAAFDSDDDERDDTYDAEDVGASVDTATPGPDGAENGSHDKNEEALFRAYSMTPELFARDPDTRRSKARNALKGETNLTDEAIEGWGIMNARDPRRLRRLEAKYSSFTGQQHELESTTWRSSPADSDTETRETGGDTYGQRGGRGRGRGRARGRGGGRGGGNVAGPAEDASTQIARQRKDAHKGSRANHNRKEQRGKKMARGAFSG